MLLAGVLAALALTDTIAKWHIVVVAVVGGIVNALDMPARHAFVVEMVQEKEDLASAIALNSTLFNGARLIGPSLAGFLVAAWSEGGCFLINAISFLAVLAALTAMRVSPRPIDDGHESLWASLRDGMQYVRGSAPIKAALLTLAAISLIGLPYAVLMPMFARDVLHGGPHTLGLLVSASAAGSVLGAIYLASRHTVVGLERGIPVALAAFSLSALVFASSRDLWLSVAVLVGAGGGLMVVFASCNTLVQTVVDDDKRGRVMSLYTLSFAGTSPFGALLVGARAGRFGAPTTVIACGVACLLTAVFYAAALPRLGAALRPVYDGLQTHAPTEERPDE
jgi:MFS family permease